MPWSFLNPWLWLGAVALGAPVWLHLRRRQQTNLFRFSTLRFLDDQPTPRQTPLRLRDLLLFLVRVLALLLIVGAFAWPYLRAHTVPVEESRVYILDNTMSHQANEGFQRDRDRLATELAGAGNNLQIAVIELAANPRVLVSFGDERQAAGRKIKELQPSFQRGSYLAAFRQADSMLNNSLGTRKRIVLLGDNQENQWNENVNSPPFLRNAEVNLPKTDANPRPNLSLAEAQAQRVFLGDKSLVNFTVKLSHSGPAKTADVALHANGQGILSKSVELDAQPGNILIQAQWEADPATWVRGDVSVMGGPDALAADNRVFFSLPPVVEGKVALLAQSAYLRLALSPEIMRGQWALRLIEASKLGAELATGEEADVLCIESNFLQSGDARKLLSKYLADGRGVILLLNHVTPAVTAYLHELGFEVENTVTATKDQPERLRFMLSNHPIFHPFVSPDYGNLGDIKIYKYVRLQSSQALPLAFSERGTSLFFQGTKSRGKLLVIPFGLDREHTSWPIHQTFIPFLDLAMQNARAEDPTPLNFEPGEVALVPMPPNSTAREVILLGGVGGNTDAPGSSRLAAPGDGRTPPQNGSELFRGPVEQNRAEVRMPGRPGLYTLTCDNDPSPWKVFSVNPSPKESELKYVADPAAIKLWRLETPAGTDPKPAKPSLVSQATVLQQRVWWWMVVGGLTMLGCEMLVTGLKQRNATP